MSAVLIAQCTVAVSGWRSGSSAEASDIKAKFINGVMLRNTQLLFQDKVSEGKKTLGTLIQWISVYQ